MQVADDDGEVGIGPSSGQQQGNEAIVGLDGHHRSAQRGEGHPDGPRSGSWVQDDIAGPDPDLADQAREELTIDKKVLVQAVGIRGDAVSAEGATDTTTQVGRQRQGSK